ncbi:hypothetical protein H2203_002212 [Taxawa tesnikishii (nom. ined.)]|nr:hypothetical protein H2203_002212 [Dothideales sp. JES 119]
MASSLFWKGISYAYGATALSVTFAIALVGELSFEYEQRKRRRPFAWLFSSTLCSTLGRSTTLVALDLPGYGGSDSLDYCGANDVLNAISEAIVALKDKHLPPSEQEGGKRANACLLAMTGEEWCIAYRLAAEAPALFDRVVILNSTFPPHARAMTGKYLEQAKQPWTMWKQRPWQLSLLRQARSVASPVTSQLLKSNYIFIFNLPSSIVALISGKLVAWLVGECHQIAYRSKGPLPASLAADATASSNGPSPAECTNGAYSASVASRATRSGDWMQKILYYRQGLATRPWENKSVHLPSLSTPTRSSGVESNDDSTALLSSSHPQYRLSSQLRVPMTVVYGLKDIALDPRICLDGIGGFIASDVRERSNIIRLPKCGHWAMLEQDGRSVIDAVLWWCHLEGTQEGNGGKSELEARLSQWTQAGVTQIEWC